MANANIRVLSFKSVSSERQSSHESSMCCEWVTEPGKQQVCHSMYWNLLIQSCALCSWVSLLRASVKHQVACAAGGWQSLGVRRCTMTRLAKRWLAPRHTKHLKLILRNWKRLLEGEATEEGKWRRVKNEIVLWRMARLWPPFQMQ